jgi:hypothetical protein
VNLFVIWSRKQLDAEITSNVNKCHLLVRLVNTMDASLVSRDVSSGTKGLSTSSISAHVAVSRYWSLHKNRHPLLVLWLPHCARGIEHFRKVFINLDPLCSFTRDRRWESDIGISVARSRRRR